MSDSSTIGLALEMKQVGKRFPATIAVDSVDFDVYAGEVHALVGENGAGKSTLMKMLAGSFSDYTGSISINGKEVKLHSPAIAKQYGIGMIYQELSLAQPISIVENLLAGRLPKKGFFVDWQVALRRAKKMLASVGLDLDPELPIEDISQHEAQLVEIAKVLGTNPCILVMDEPTSALSQKEVELLFRIIGDLKNRGLAIVYISHHLPEIFRVADRVTVMRDAKIIDTKPIKEVTREEIVKMMVGKSVKEFFTKEGHDTNEPCLIAKGVTRYGFFHDINFAVHRGEILGISGLSGAGRSELARVICGLDKSDEGSVELEGEEINNLAMAARIKRGVGYLPEDRKIDGLALRLLVDDNIISAVIPTLTKGGVYNKAAGDGLVKKQINDLSIYPPDPKRTAGNLSGGNQQKMLLAKWLAIEPKVILLDEPTRGVDIGAKMIIHEAIRNIARNKNSVILISSDLPELIRLCDRVLIMRKGHFTKEMPREECSEEALLLAANEEVNE